MACATNSARKRLLNQHLPNLTTLATAQHLALGLPAGISMLQALGLSRREQAWLLGLSVRSLQRAEGDQIPKLGHSQLIRLSLVVGIYNALHRLYDANTAAGWLQRANPRHPFDSRTPLDHMRRGGIPAMYEARRLLDADCGGLFSVTSEARKAAPKFPTVVEL